MVQIVTPTLPLRLYRYRSLHSRDENEISQKKLDRELEAIRENYIWRSPLKELNDPMEGTLGLTPAAARDPNAEPFLREVSSMMAQMGVSCFSDTGTNDLMWAHYAGEHRGVCLEYSTHDMHEGLPDVHAARVQYDIQIPVVTAEETPDCQSAAIKALTTKSFKWSYEREWRLLATVGKLQIRGQNPIKGIYFGPRTETTAIDAIRKCLGGVRDNTIKFYRPEPLNRYRYEWKPI